MSGPKVTRRRVLKGAASVAAASVIPGFVGRAEGQTSQPVPQQNIINMKVSMSSTQKGFVRTDFIGLSYSKDWMTTAAWYVGGTGGTAKRLFDPSSTNLMNYFKTANVQSLRMCDSSDKVYVGTGGSGMLGTQIANSDIDALGGFLSTMKSELSFTCNCLYGVNLEGALIDPNPPNNGTTPPPGIKWTSTQTAHDEVEYAAVTSAMAPYFNGVEIGNEIESYAPASTDQTQNPLTYNGQPWRQQPLGNPPYMVTLETAWLAFRNKIRSDLSVKITGPAFDCENLEEFNLAAGIPTTNQFDPVQFAKDVTSSNLDLLTQHYYTGESHSGSTMGYTPASWFGTLNPTNNKYQPGLLLPSCNAASWTNPGNGAPFTQNLYLADYLLPALNGNGVASYRISECNSYFDGGAGGYSNSYGSALWAIDFMFTCAQWYATGINMHGGGNAQEATPWYTPISNSYDANGNLVLQANPLFYGLVMFGLAMPQTTGFGQMYPITLQTVEDDNEYIAYLNGFAVCTGTNQYSIVINNKYTAAYKISLANLSLAGNLQVASSPAPQVYQLTNSTATPNETLTGAENVLSDCGQYTTQINGQACTANGTFSPALSTAAYSSTLNPVYVFPLSTLLIRITTTGSI